MKMLHQTQEPENYGESICISLKWHDDDSVHDVIHIDINLKVTECKMMVNIYTNIITHHFEFELILMVGLW